MSEHPDTREPQNRPADPAGTQPRHDPESLLPAERDALRPEDVVEAEVVDEREAERGDLLPARRRSGMPSEPVAPARHSQYAPRFHFLTGALVAVGVAALVGLGLFIALPGGGQDPGGRWSQWRPTAEGAAGAQQIAEHVGSEYKLPDGHQMVDVSVTGLEIEGVPLAVALREAPAQGGDIRVFDDNGLIYRLCGLAADRVAQPAGADGAHGDAVAGCLARRPDHVAEDLPVQPHPGEHRQPRLHRARPVRRGHGPAAERQGLGHGHRHDGLGLWLRVRLVGVRLVGRRLLGLRRDGLDDDRLEPAQRDAERLNQPSTGRSSSSASASSRSCASGRCAQSGIESKNVSRSTWHAATTTSQP
jgi:hypothetical protein